MENFIHLIFIILTRKEYDFSTNDFLVSNKPYNVNFQSNSFHKTILTVNYQTKPYG